MSLVFGRNKLALLGVFVLGAFAGQFASPAWNQMVMYWNQEEYSSLVEKCDSAMKSHLLAKHRLASQPSQEHAKVLEAAELGLLDCHYYDLKRKRLGQLGLDDNDLAKMGLVAIEGNAVDLKKIVKIHEFRY